VTRRRRFSVMEVLVYGVAILFAIGLIAIMWAVAINAPRLETDFHRSTSRPCQRNAQVPPLVLALCS
jgi:hypothetical protein